MKHKKPKPNPLREWILEYGAAKLAKLCGVDRTLPYKWASGRCAITNLAHVEILLREAAGALTLADLKKGGAQ